MAIKFIEKNVAPNALFASIVLGEQGVPEIYAVKVNFSQGYNFYHLHLTAPSINWGVALSEDAVNQNTREDGTFDFYGDGILNGIWTEGLTLSHPMVKSFYLIIDTGANPNMVKIAASNSPVYPFVDNK